jgi:hypothetical protein
MIGYMQDRHATILEARLDKEQYNDEELISIKTPLNLPYYSSSSTYERAYGSVEVNGITYEYVKRRVHLDTLELLCLPDKARTHLQSAQNDFFKLSADLTSSQQQKKGATLKVSLPDFCQDMDTFSLASISKLTTKHFSSNTAFSKADYSSKSEQPPDAMQIFS